MEEKLEKMMKTIMWEPCDGQHIVYACNVLAEEAFAVGEITEEDRNNIFRRRNAIPVVYNNPKMYIEMSKRQNDFHTPNRKETHAPAWQTLIKLCALWNEYGRPKPREEEDVQRRWDMLICMAAVLNMKLDVQKTLNITNVSSKLYDWITHACREDDEAFQVLIRLGQDIDAHILHQDPSKEVAWKKYLEKRNDNGRAKEPRHVSMSINWLKPLRGLHDEDFKELLNMAQYDHDRKRQRLYFHDVDKANPQRNTLEYVSMRLRQRYAVRNALRWLHIEGSTAMYKRMEDFMKIDITRFGEHDTLVALDQLDTRTFINHWSSPLYVRVSALKKYASEIPGAVRAHYQDIVNGGTRFSGKVKLIGEHSYTLRGWLWETHLQKPVRGLKEVRDVQILHRGELFTGGYGQLGEPALWVVDCRWGGKGGVDKPWAYEDYATAMHVMGRWMHASPRWNVAFLCPEGDDMRSLVKELERADRIVHHRSWSFTEETAMHKECILFDNQEVLLMEVVGDVILIMICPPASNPIENIPRSGGPVPRSFQDHASKYASKLKNNICRTPEEVSHLINAYLPKDWALVLVELSTSVRAVLDEGFIGSRIVTLDEDVERTTTLTEWIRQHEGAHFQYSGEKAEASEEPDEDEEEDEQGKEQGEENEYRLRTFDLEPLSHAEEVQAEHGALHGEDEMVKPVERNTIEERAEQLHVQDSGSTEGRMQSAEHHVNEEENVGEADHILKQNAIDNKKQKHRSCIGVNESTSTMKRPRTTRSIPKKNRSERKRTATQALEKGMSTTTSVISTLSPTTCSEKNEV